MRARRDPVNPLPTMTISHGFNSGRSTCAAGDSRPRTPADVRTSQALHALCAAMVTRRQPLDIPQVGGNDDAGELQAAVECIFQLQQCRRCEMAQCLESLYFSIPAAHRDDRYDGRATLDRILDSTHRPRDRLFRWNVRCAEEGEYAEIDAVV